MQNENKTPNSTNPEQVSQLPKDQTKPPFKKNIRGNKKLRLGIIVFLLALVAILFVFWEKARIALVIAFLALLAALGLEISNNDWDLGRLIQTKSFDRSKVTRDESGNVLFDVFGEKTTDATKGKKADDYNCDDFNSQPSAQAFFEKVGGLGNDLNRLDGDKDGQACESLPKNSK